MKNIVSSSSRIPRVHVSQLNCPMGHNSSVLPRDTQFLPFEKTTAECRAELTSSALYFSPSLIPAENGGRETERWFGFFQGFHVRFRSSP